MMFIVVFGYFSARTLSHSPNHSLSLSDLWGGVKFSIFTLSISAVLAISQDCFFVTRRLGAVMLTMGRACRFDSIFRYVGSIVSRSIKSTDRSIPSHPASFARVKILSSPYHVRERVERRNIGVKSEKWKAETFDLRTAYFFLLLQVYSSFLKTPKNLTFFHYWFGIQWIWYV